MHRDVFLASSAVPTEYTHPLRDRNSAAQEPRRMRSPSTPRLVYGDGHRVPRKPVPESKRDTRLGLRGFASRLPRSQDDNRDFMADVGGWGSQSLQGALSSPSGHGLRVQMASPVPSSGQDGRASIYSPWPDCPQRPEYLLSPPGTSESNYNFGRKPGTTTTTRSRSQTSPARSPSTPARVSPVPVAAAAAAAAAAWEPPTLSQAYAQAIRHVQLPTCTASIDALLRAQGSREDVDIIKPSFSAGSSNATGAATAASDRAASMKLEWVNKIYILVLGGYLLQYAAEGSSDRLPEKMLPLSKDSAAFASDLIPGRHWVLRVCSALDAGISSSSNSSNSSSSIPGDARSLLSRLPFRGSDSSDRSDRRQAPNILMVFDGAEDMEGWIATLRREIETLGGKKHLSETGAPIVFPRTVAVVRGEPGQASRILSTQQQDVPSLRARRRESCMAGMARPRDSSLEGPQVSDADNVVVSTANNNNNIHSQDSRPLENLNLRDRRNRHSCISSLPASSARNSISSNPGEDRTTVLSAFADTTREGVRLRPRASTVNEGGRPSLYTVAAHHPRAAESHGVPRRYASYQDMQSSQQGAVSFAAVGPPPRHPPPPPPVSVPGSGPGPMPNFSVPHSSRRYSCMPPTQKSPERTASVSMRKPPPPPPSLFAYSRPLSVVADQPSPALSPDSPFTHEFLHEAASSTTTAATAAAATTTSTITTTSYGSEVSESPRVSSQRSRSRSSSSVSFNTLIAKPPRGDALPLTAQQKTPKKQKRSLRSTLAAKFQSLVQSDSLSSLMTTAEPYSYTMAQPIIASPVVVEEEEKNKTLPFLPPSSSPEGEGELPPPPPETTLLPDLPPQIPMLQPMPPMLPLSPLPQVDQPPVRPASAASDHAGYTVARPLSTKTSTYSFVEGPPPAPPPTCALPPLPPKAMYNDELQRGSSVLKA